MRLCHCWPASHLDTKGEQRDGGSSWGYKRQLRAETCLRGWSTSHLDSLCPLSRTLLPFVPEGGLGQIGLDAAQHRDTGAQDGPGSARLPARGALPPVESMPAPRCGFPEAITQNPFIKVGL